MQKTKRVKIINLEIQFHQFDGAVAASPYISRSRGGIATLGVDV